MKTKIISAISILLAFPMFAQVTYESNDPNFGSPLGYIGMPQQIWISEQTMSFG